MDTARTKQPLATRLGSSSHFPEDTITAIANKRTLDTNGKYSNRLFLGVIHQGVFMR